jgi:hypothetical protein
MKINKHFLKDFELEKNKKKCFQAQKIKMAAAFKMAAEFKMAVKRFFHFKISKMIIFQKIFFCYVF